MAGFGYDKFEDIDLVYPKVIKSKEVIIELIDRLLNTSLINLEKTGEDNSYIMQIDSFLKKQKMEVIQCRRR